MLFRSDDVLAALYRVADLSSSPEWGRDPLYLDLDAVRRLSRQIRLEVSLGERDLDGWEARLVDLERDRGLRWTKKGRGASFGGGVVRADVLAARDTLVTALQAFKWAADADLAAGLQADLASATAGYESRKAAAGALDFADLLDRTLALLRDDSTVRGHLQRKYARIFVDEFQDTDAVQAEIL